MAKLKLERCPECGEEVFGIIKTVSVDGGWQDVWECPECGYNLFFENEEND